MREILFRGKRNYDHEWVYGDLLQIPSKNSCAIIEQKPVANNYSVIPSTVGQYTGLTDKNGKEVFEGDIIEFTDNLTINGSKIHLSVVEWLEQFGGFLIKAKCVGYYSVNPSQAEKYKYKVIGNIHENPELLK